MKQIVIYHRADFDGIFCREIAKKFLPDAELIGWDYGDPIPSVVPQGMLPEHVDLYMLDISVDGLMDFPGLTWIDHHKSAIEKFRPNIVGYRIDGVAACRLAWQWFTNRPVDPKPGDEMPFKEDFLERRVVEPLAVRLAGEYDIWDHRGDGDIEFQFGLDCEGGRNDFSILLSHEGDKFVPEILQNGRAAMRCYAKRDADTMRSRSFMVEWEGLKFLALTTARCNSNTFAAKDVPETGHDALMAFFFNGSSWTFSLYHAAHRKDIDLSLIAVKHGGGGHRGACGFRAKELPFLKM